MFKNKHSYKSALITGASRGIGLAIAKLLAQSGFRLILHGLDQQELADAEKDLKLKFPNCQMVTIVADLAIQSGIMHLIESLEALDDWPDVWINNAGLGSYGYFWENEAKRESKMINLNCQAVHQLTRYAITKMVEFNKGHVVNISSITAFQPIPLLSTYAASKAFIFSLSYAVNKELALAKKSVYVSVICPTQVKTKFEQDSGLDQTGLYKSWMLIQPLEVAECVLRALDKKGGYYVPRRSFHLLNLVTRRLPFDWIMRIALNSYKVKY